MHQNNTLIIYESKKGKSPFTKWLETLEIKTQVRIRNRLVRMELGHLGDVKSIGDGIFELRIFFGPGYRLYFGTKKSQIIILLCGGDKSSQNRDILNARKYWCSYQEVNP
ncbi:MAG: addiction module killer protein [Alphaproteobacteria bacterium 16-39-46]|nr:MAG: addiction module killer protein [Alphaproteobacteria bacterium 16-39-46]OZA41503.1 MAG: addiction module killer protein [Alphaproteobacteria bacterium 17-39-52]HQS84783.1 type II toxin-antitoxin system RelE/ParE family toxin [Alphaproteobacteria bacterium]HQS94465.1 type II toxin-antitoxin system RelE/ParE family toxin [Alphaproteobacteria bacterium]